MKNRNIFSSQNQTIIRLFERAGHPDKVLCIPLDYAKGTHMALCCNGTGAVVKNPFPVENSPQGIDFLIKTVDKLCRKHHIKRESVFFGGEDCGTFAANFIYRLRREGFAVIGVNPKEAKKHRENLQASTDKLDLLGIASMLIHKRGHLVGESIDAQRALRTLTRHRRKLVKTQTAVGNQIHAVVDELLPGFMDEQKSGIPPFSRACLALMEKSFSAQTIARRQEKALIRTLRGEGLKQADEAAIKLKIHARSVLQTANELSGMLQISLNSQVQLYRCLDDNIKNLNLEIALQLAKTPAAMCTTVRGIGITLAAGTSAEIGDPQLQPSLRKLCSYSGIIPRIKQTGGPEKVAHVGSVSRQCNRILKDYAVQCASHLGLHGPPEYMADHRRRIDHKQHANFGIARRFLRMAMRLMRTGESYVPPELRHGVDDIEQLQTYYLQLWPKLLDKWVKANAWQEAFNDENPLGQWRKRIEEIYDINLPLPTK